MNPLKIQTAKIVKGQGITTGFPDLDEAINGFEKKELTVIAGRPSTGKTAIMLDFAMKAGESVNVGIFSLEMDYDSLVTRMIANKQETTFKSLTRGEVQPNDKTKSYLDGLKIHIDDRSGITSGDVVQVVSDFNAKNKFDIVFIDHLSLVRPPQFTRKRNEEVEKISEHFKNMAKFYDIPIVLNCQLNREIEKRENHEPRLSDLRDSGGIEQNADKVILLHRPNYWCNHELNQEEDDSEGWLIVAKQRNGEVGRIPVVWLGDFMSYRPVTFRLEKQF